MKSNQADHHCAPQQFMASRHSGLHLHPRRDLDLLTDEYVRNGVAPMPATIVSARGRSA